MSSVDFKSKDSRFDLKRIGGGLLAQSPDALNFIEGQLKVASKRGPNAREMEDMNHLCRIFEDEKIAQEWPL